MPGCKRILLINHKIYKIAVFLLLIFHLTGARAQGLMFNSNDSLLNKRTSYNVFGANTPTFQNHLYINFDLSLWDNQNLGYIFSLTGKNDSYSLSYLYLNGTGFLNFNIDRKSNKLKIRLQQSQLSKRKWIKVKVDLDLNADRVKIYIDDKLYQAGGVDMEDTIAPKLIFGKNPYYVEVPDMAIKNLVVGDNSKTYSFPLNEWEGNVVHSSTGEEIGTIENPVWLINESYTWKPLYSQTFHTVAGLNFDPITQKLFIFRRDSLITFDSERKNVTAQAFKNQSPIPLLLGKSIFNAKENKCYVYEVYNDQAPGAVSVASLDMQTLQWESIGKTTFKQQRHHHNIFYNKNQDSIYLFGGYGAYSYYNAFYTYNRKADSWDRINFKGDTITPRFFSATGKADNDNEIFIFGGYGNESGSQIVGGKQYYDLYRVNLQTHTIKKCWNIHPNEVFVPANNLVLSKDKKYFYALCYPHEIFKTSIRLYKFSIKDGSYQIVSAPIPVVSERIESDINLFLDNKTSELLCTIQEFTDPSTSNIKIYSLAFPPVSRESYLLTLQAHGKLPVLLYGGFFILLMLVTGALAWFYKAQKDKKLQKQFIPILAETEEEEPVLQKTEEPKKNSVYILGEFTVFDNRGRDITYLFSPKIKQLFILILLNSKDGNGIGSKKISHILWPDKDINKTKNIKGVTFNHLRNIIGDIDSIELTYLNDIYFFHIDEAFFCDYYFIWDALKKAVTEKEELIFEHFELINRGSLLTDMSDAWLDDFKLNYEERLMNHLLPQLQILYAEESYKTVLEISRLILNIDPFNDTALKYQLKSYRRIKGIEYCKKVYDQYTAEYKKSLGIDYPFSLDKVLQ